MLPALLVMAWLLAGLPLLLAGVFTPVLMLVLSVPLAAVLLVLGLRWLPARWPERACRRRPGQAGTPWWAVVAVIAVAVAFGVDQMIYHSQQIIVTRDPASYIQFANWISQHGSLPIPQDAGGVRRHPQVLHVRQLRLLPGRPNRRAAVHGGPADGPGGRVLDRRRDRGGADGRRCSAPARCSPSAAWPPGSPGRAGRRWPPSSSRSPCPSSSPAGRPTASRWRRSCSSAGCAWSSTRWRPKAGRPGCWRRSAAWRSA